AEPVRENHPRKPASRKRRTQRRKPHRGRAGPEASRAGRGVRGGTGRSRRGRGNQRVSPSQSTRRRPAPEGASEEGPEGPDEDGETRGFPLTWSGAASRDEPRARSLRRGTRTAARAGGGGAEGRG